MARAIALARISHAQCVTRKRFSVGDRSKIEAVRAWMREQEANGFTAFQRRDWRDVAKCSFCGANGHEVEQFPVPPRIFLSGANSGANLRAFTERMRGCAKKRWLKAERRNSSRPPPSTGRRHWLRPPG